jgi:erythrin-vacuolar iron transport family protein
MPVNLDFSKLDLMDALDLAVLIEVEAMTRYQTFAKQLGYSGPGDASSMFGMMATSEGKHAADLSKRREALFGDAPLRVKRTDIFDVEAPEEGSPRWDMSPLKALQVALSSEEKAHDFYDQAIPYVTDESVRALFQELRDEETEHVEMVKEAMAKLPPGAAYDLEDADA